jgi:thiamine pyrophosphate-dependent acetolactate synthase large subunit-like protein
VSRNSEPTLLCRTPALRELVPEPEHHLIVAGLGTPCFDAARLTDDGDNLFAIDGAMGTATAVGTGLALAQPHRRILVITGDGELLMSLGSLPTAATAAPPNLSILCIDNAAWGLTGFQRTHTSFHTDLAAVAAGSGIPACMTVRQPADLPAGRAMLEDDSQVTFVVLRVPPEPPEPYAFERDGVLCRARFREYVLGSSPARIVE